MESQALSKNSKKETSLKSKEKRKLPNSPKHKILLDFAIEYD